jgi:hypothetical protein
LRDNAVYWLVKGSVDAADFGAAIDQRVYAAIKRRLESGETAEPSTVATMLGNYEWDAPGGAQAYLTDLADKAASPAQAGELARRIGQVQSRRRKNVPLYMTDIVAWSHRQAELLAQLAERTDERSREVDWENVIEEVLSVGRSQVRGVARKIELVLAHLLKAVSDPDAPSRRGWRHEIDTWRNRLRSEFTPSMRPLIDLDALWTRAREEAAGDLDEYGVSLDRGVPARCPFAFDDLIGEASMETLMKQLATAMSGLRDPTQAR